MKKNSKAKIAATYALALYEAAISKKNAEAVFEDVEKLRSIILNEPQIIKYLANPLWNNASKMEALGDIAQKTGLGNETLECLDVIAENRRFAELPLILDEFMHIYYAKNGIAEVKVVSAKKLSAAQSGRLQKKMETRLGRKVLLHNEVDAGILGGLRVMYGSEMIDASLEDKLNRLEIVMKGGL